MSKVNLLNPLAYIPNTNPMLLRDSQLFGPIPRDLPVGSAVLAPGQAPPRLLPPPAPAPAPVPAFQPKPQAPAAPVPAAAPPSRSWQDLLAQAAQAYAAAQPLTSSDLAPFRSSATSLAREALADRAPGASIDLTGEGSRNAESERESSNEEDVDMTLGNGDSTSASETSAMPAWKEHWQKVGEQREASSGTGGGKKRRARKRRVGG